MKSLRQKTTKLYESCCDLIKQLNELSEEERKQAVADFSFTMSLCEGIVDDALDTLKNINAPS